jgi:outer membrane lipoprotein-sorting protein
MVPVMRDPSQGRRGGVVLLGWLLLGLPGGAAGQERPEPPDPREILRAMGEAAEGIRDYTTTLVRQERFGDRLVPEQTIFTKWARPQSLYTRFIRPHEGREALYVRGRNRDRVKAHKGSFPDITVNINPTGSWAMKGSHHPASKASLVYLVRLVLDNVAEADRRGEGVIRYLRREILWGRACDTIELVSPKAGVVHTVARGETLWDLARRYGHPMHTLLHHNRKKGWDEPDDPRRGDQVFIPRYTNGRVVLTVDRELGLPLRALIYDHEGNLYERYEHRDLRINVGLTDRDFDPKNPEYDF